jgi:hypothetical protein
VLAVRVVAAVRMVYPAQHPEVLAHQVKVMQAALMEVFQETHTPLAVAAVLAR